MTFDRITIEPGKMNGQPCIRGMRLTVRRVVLELAVYKSFDALQKEFSKLEEEDIVQALEYAAAILDDELIELPAKSSDAA